MPRTITKLTDTTARIDEPKSEIADITKLMLRKAALERMKIQYEATCPCKVNQRTLNKLNADITELEAAGLTATPVTPINSDAAVNP